MEHRNTGTQEHSRLLNKHFLFTILLLTFIFGNETYAQDDKEHSLFVCQDRTVRAFGWNMDCQIGTGSISYTGITTPVIVSDVENAVAVAIGEQHSLALLDDGTVVAWGSNSNGASGMPYPLNINVCQPNTIEIPGCVVAVSAGGSFSLALLADGTVYAWAEDSTLTSGKHQTQT